MGIKGAEGFKFLANKSAMILEVFERFDKGLLILASRGEFLEKLVRFGGSLEAIRTFARDARFFVSANLQLTFWKLFWRAFDRKLVPL